jgi:hypothetical protein
MAVYEHARIERSGEKTYSAHTDPVYWNAVGPFGGWLAAVFLRCTNLETGDVGDPLTFSINFAGAMQPGAFTVRLRSLRTNRSTSFWSTELLQTQDGVEVLCAFATIVIARRRETPAFAETIAPEAAPPEGLHRFSARAGLSFLQRLDLRFAGGGPVSNSPDRKVVMWARSLDATSMDYETLTTLCDAGLPHIFVRLKRPVPVSSVTLNVFYHATRDDLVPIGEDFLLTESRMRAAGHGFFDEATSVWSRAGKLLATTEQVVWFKVPE